MDDMERLVAQVEHLVELQRQNVEQVKTLAETSALLIQRSEQLYHIQDERTAVLPQLAEQLQAAIDEIETTDEALKESLSDLDGAIDDVSAATAGLLVIQQQANQDEANEQ